MHVRGSTRRAKLAWLETKWRLLAGVVGLTLTIIGCATTGGYEKILNSWLGDTESHLVSSWGPPQSIYLSPDGSRILTYVSQRTAVIPGYTAPTTTHVTGQNVGNMFSGTATTYNYSTPPTAVQMTCQTHFTVQDGKIVSWSYRGNACRA